jgi:Na+/H+ antiporter NhaD/arsenite permease-like protein
MACFAGLSLATTPRRIHEANRFTWAPILEVGAVFAGIFVTMVPALAVLQDRAASLGITEPRQFFWASGALSSVLDNAPTYLTFASVATGVVNAGGAALSIHDLGPLAAHPTGASLLAAVSCGSVLMGAMTYIGNGPNFMVKAIAEQHHVRMPSFFGYVLWSVSILGPVLVAVSLLVF